MGRWRVYWKLHDMGGVVRNSGEDPNVRPMPATEDLTPYDMFASLYSLSLEAQSNIDKHSPRSITKEEFDTPEMQRALAIARQKTKRALHPVDIPSDLQTDYDPAYVESAWNQVFNRGETYRHVLHPLTQYLRQPQFNVYQDLLSRLMNPAPDDTMIPTDLRE